MKLHVVLVGTLYSRNLGSCSRVMANMGGGRLITIQAQCEYNLEARQGAAGAQTHLVTRTSYQNWQEFFDSEPNGIRVAFSAIDKFETDPEKIEYRANEIARLISDRNNEHYDSPIYLIFGPEDNGLSQKDVELANFICQLPTYGNYSSLNLSHAVLLALYIFQNSYTQLINKQNDTPAISVTNTENERFHFPDAAIKEWLTTLGFDIGRRRKDVYKTLKRILLHNMVTPRELRIFEAVVFQTVRKLKK